MKNLQTSMHNVLVIGSGGREHAITLSLLKSPQVLNVFILNGNGGTSAISKNVKCILDINPNEHEKILHLINQESIQLTIVGPEEPLSNGIADFLELNGKKVFGPVREGAKLEFSKIFMKDVLVKAGIPTAKYKTFDSNQKDEAFKFIEEFSTSSIVIKTDGLAAGKGVVICKNQDEAKTNLLEFFNGKFGEASKKVVIEEFLDGVEASLFGITDGKTTICFKSACDHKRIFENDLGENTGGMGTFSPSFLTEVEEESLTKTLIEPVVLELKKRGIKYKGVLFAGLMIENGVAKVLEFNVRFGDPETQSLLTRFEGDFYELCYRTATETLAGFVPKFTKKYALTVVLASKGYPQSSSKGDEIYLPSNLQNDEFIFHAGTKLESGRLFTNGGRVLGVTALGKTKLEARNKAYLLASKIKFDGMQTRNDIGEDLISFEINFADTNWKTLGIGFYDFFKKLLKVTLKTHFAKQKPFINDASKCYEFSILLTNDTEIQKLNKDYRGKDKPTNSLSFPIREEYTKDRILMGDIVLSLTTLQKEAIEQNKNFTEHLAHLFIHSTLHLAGYDHEEESEMAEMEALEDEIMQKLEEIF
jgi:phosphoribosylamine--glycine ligase